MLKWLQIAGFTVFSLLLVTPARAERLSRAWGPPSPDDAEEPEPLGGEELLAAIPDLRLRDELPPFVFTPFFSVRVPFQPLGAGVVLDASPIPWLRLGLLYSAGISPGKDELKFSNYAEALLGLRVLSSRSLASVDLKFKQRLAHDQTLIRASIPSRHSLFLEGGAFTGFLSLQRCTANCDSQTAAPALVEDDLQLFWPMAGLRYFYFYDTASESRHLRKKMSLQIFAHLISLPLNEPDHQVFDWSGDQVGRTSIGGRVGVDLPPIGGCIASYVLGAPCFQGGIAVGYNPMPASPTFELHLSTPLY